MKTRFNLRGLTVVANIWRKKWKKFGWESNEYGGILSIVLKCDMEFDGS